MAVVAAQKERSPGMQIAEMILALLHRIVIIERIVIRITMIIIVRIPSRAGAEAGMGWLSLAVVLAVVLKLSIGSR